MKKQLLVMTMAVIAAIVVGRPASGAGGAGVRLDREVTLRVERGDTLLGLFGPDLMKVVERNRDLIPSPHRLGEGLEVVAPAYTYLSPRAVDRLNRDRQLRQEAWATVRKAQAAQKALPGGGDSAVAGPAYAEAQKVLARALQALVGTPPNYLAARELGEEALRLLAISSGQVQLARQMEEIKRRQAEAEATRAQRIRVATAFLIPALGSMLSLWIVRRRQHNARLREGIRQRLQEHFQHLQEL